MFPTQPRTEGTVAKSFVWQDRQVENVSYMQQITARVVLCTDPDSSWKPESCTLPLVQTQASCSCCASSRQVFSPELRILMWEVKMVKVPCFLPCLLLIFETRSTNPNKAKDFSARLNDLQEEKPHNDRHETSAKFTTVLYKPIFHEMKTFSNSCRFSYCFWITAKHPYCSLVLTKSTIQLWQHSQQHCHLPAHWKYQLFARNSSLGVTQTLLAKHLPWGATVIIDLYRNVCNKLQEGSVFDGSISTADNCCWTWWNRLFTKYVLFWWSDTQQYTIMQIASVGFGQTAALEDLWA